MISSTQNPGDGTPDSESVIAPRGLAHYIKSLPFLGQISTSLRSVEAGSYQQLVLTYVVGASGIADSGRLKVTFKFYSDWADPQTEDPRGANYLSAEFQPRAPFAGESDATVRMLKVSFDPKGHERPFQKAIMVDIVDGYIRPGDRIELRLGDIRGGGAGSRVQTFAETAFRFRAYVDTAGTSRLAAVPGDLVLDIVPAPPVLLRLITARLARPGVPVPVVARLEDAWGNACRDVAGEVILRRLPSDEIQLPLPKNGPAVVRQEFIFDTEGHFLLEAVAAFPSRGAALQASAPITIDQSIPMPRALFADLHVHSHDTVGTNSTEANLTYARDVAALDVFGYTVNDFQVTRANWEEAVNLCKRFDTERQFIVFPGTEWCGNSAAGGDHNVVFLGDEVRFPLDRTAQSIRSFEWHENMRGAGSSQPHPGKWPISDWYLAHADAPDQFLMIPHVGGRRAILDWHHPDLERLVEIASSWGHFQWLYDEALARGYQVGASAAGDEHRGRPGGGAPGTAVFGVRGGLTGLISQTFDRPSVARALRSRHTWATTGERNVALLWSGDALQGDGVQSHAGSVKLQYRLLGNSGWEHIAIRDHAGAVFSRDLHRELGWSANRLRIRWGGARVKDRYRWADWQLQIRVQGSKVILWQARGLEHPEETAIQPLPGVFDVATTTCGDADDLELELDSPETAIISVHATISGAYGPHTTEPIQLNFSGREFFASPGIRKELGGVELFIAAERVTARPLPFVIDGEIEIPLRAGPNGKAWPLYLFAREIDDAKVWTSPLFVNP